MAKELICTGDVHWQHEIIDTIFTIDSHTGGLLSSSDPGKAFDSVKDHLKKECKKVGGKAVLNCQFEYRVAVEKGLVVNKQYTEIFAYGTAIRWQTVLS